MINPIQFYQQPNKLEHLGFCMIFHTKRRT